MNRFERFYIKHESCFYTGTLALTMVLCLLAYLTRGYLASGGETLTMLLPIAYSVYIRTKDEYEEEKQC